MEGSRPLLVEVQALVSSSTFGNARRMASGIDRSRLALLLAVLEKRAGLNLMGEDVFVNIAGGMTVDEPASDLSVAAAVASSLRNRPVAAATAVFRRDRSRRRGPRRVAGAAARPGGGAARVQVAACCRARISNHSTGVRPTSASWLPSATLGEALDVLIQ